MLKSAVDAKRDRLTIQNLESFAWTLLDDYVSLMVFAPDVVEKPGGPRVILIAGKPVVELRCPAPPTLAAGAVLEIQFDGCTPTTYEPGAGAHYNGVYLPAKEGFVSTQFEPQISFTRQLK